jgi:hypothetical protein
MRPAIYRYLPSLENMKRYRDARPCRVIRLAIVRQMKLFSLPIDKDESFEVCWTLMLGHPHLRIILPPSVEAKALNGKTIGAK